MMVNAWLPEAGGRAGGNVSEVLHHFFMFNGYNYEVLRK